MSKFLFEILSEEIPANLQSYGANELYRLFKLYGLKRGLIASNEELFYTAQRIAFRCDLMIEVKEVITHVRGTRIGADEKIFQAFLRTQRDLNYKIIELENKYHALEYREIINQNQQAIKSNISFAVVKALKDFDWQEEIMRWRSCLPKWIRPIRSILCLLEKEIIDFEFAGVKSSNYTHGHKILSSWGKVCIEHPNEYAEKLERAFVVLDPMKRLSHIKSQVPSHIFKDKKIENLINELSCIAEYPQVMISEVSEEFLSLPKDLIEYIMIIHQKYIPIRDEDDQFSGKYVVIVDHNNITDEIKRGYSRVLDARLTDGKFHWDKFINTEPKIMMQNLQTTISEHNGEISVYSFNKFISKFFKDSKKAFVKLNVLSCDLSSSLITEYPALRGLMVTAYLRKHGVTL